MASIKMNNNVYYFYYLWSLKRTWVQKSSYLYFITTSKRGRDLMANQTIELLLGPPTAEADVVA